MPIATLLWFHARVWLIPTVVIFCSFAVWAVPHTRAAELHFTTLHVLLSGWYVRFGLGFLALTGIRYGSPPGPAAGPEAAAARLYRIRPSACRFRRAAIRRAYVTSTQGGFMEYMMFVATDTEPDTREEAPGEVDDWVAEGARRGIRLRGDALRPIQDATTVRVRGEQLLVTDGPFTESKEWIVGYDLLDCEDLDQAIDYVSRHPMARSGRIEIRPVAQFDG